MAEQLEGQLVEPPVGSNILVDHEDIPDVDSALGDEDRTSVSTSLNSTVTEYRYDHGRRYHAFDEDAYWLPNDDIEIARLDIQHHVWQLSLNGKLHISPIPEDVQHVVDIGTGTGRWAIEFAELHPSAQVIGTDLSPIQPAWTPLNCSFLIDNAEADWVFEQPFDFIHSRMLLMGIHDWPRYFKQTWENLKPGAWMEVQEVQFPIGFADGTVTLESPLYVLTKLVREAAAKVGIDTMVTEKFKDHLVDQGFVNIRGLPLKWYLGPWPEGAKEKSIGKWTLENTNQFISAIAMSLFPKHLDWSTEQVESFLVDVKKDLADTANGRKHYYWQMYIFSAQKPELVD